MAINRRAAIPESSITCRGRCATGAHGLDSIWASACPNKGRCGQRSRDSIRSAIGSGALSSTGINDIRSHPALAGVFQQGWTSGLSVGGAVSRRIVITHETSGESKSLARSLSEGWGFEVLLAAASTRTKSRMQSLERLHQFSSRSGYLRLHSSGWNPQKASCF